MNDTKLIKTVDVKIPLTIKKGRSLFLSEGEFSCEIDGEKVTGRIGLGGSGFVVSWRETVFTIDAKDICKSILNYISENIPEPTDTKEGQNNET